MNCVDLENILSDYIEKILPTESVRSIEEHLKICPACRQLVEEVSWIVEKCGDFPVIDPPEELEGRILARTAPTKRARALVNLILHPRTSIQLSPTYALSASIMILLIIGAIINLPGIAKNLNRYTHQAYSIGLKYYYGTEKIKEEISTMKEDFPSKLDTGVAKSIGWIKNKMKKEEKKDGEKKEKVEMQGIDYLTNA